MIDKKIKMEKSELELNQEVLRKLEDIKNSCQSLVEKIGQLQVDLFDHPDKDLERSLDKLNNDFSKNHAHISEICGIFEQKVSEIR